MDSGGMIVMDGGIGDGHWQCNERQDGKAVAMGNGMVVAQLTAQWAAYNCCQCKSGTIGGNKR
jgi:hypothetical protein